MNTPSRNDLLGYLLGALEAHECEQIEASLLSRPDLQLELLRIKEQFAPLEECRPPLHSFPVGLARRTCEVVARARHEVAISCPTSPSTAPTSSPSLALEPCIAGKALGSEEPLAVSSLEMTATHSFAPNSAMGGNAEHCRYDWGDLATSATKPNPSLSPTSGGVLPTAARRSLLSAALVGCAALCGAMVGPMLMRETNARVEPIVVVPAAAFAQHDERHKPAIQNVSSRAPISIGEPLLISSWTSDWNGEVVPLLGMPSAIIEQPISFHPISPHGTIDLGRQRLASGPSSLLQYRSDSWSEGPAIEFISE